MLNVAYLQKLQKSGIGATAVGNKCGNGICNK